MLHALASRSLLLLSAAMLSLNDAKRKRDFGEFVTIDAGLKQRQPSSRQATCPARSPGVTGFRIGKLSGSSSLHAPPLEFLCGQWPADAVALTLVAVHGSEMAEGFLVLHAFGDDEQAQTVR
jgi:hypothetical protein